MRPQQIAAENATPYCQHSIPFSCFNEAAANRCGKRAASTADGGLYKASMRPQQIAAENTSLRRQLVVQAKEASMRPQQIAAENFDVAKKVNLDTLLQ